MCTYTEFDQQYAHITLLVPNKQIFCEYFMIQAPNMAFIHYIVAFHNITCIELQINSSIKCFLLAMCML